MEQRVVLVKESKKLRYATVEFYVGKERRMTCNLFGTDLRQNQ